MRFFLTGLLFLMPSITLAAAIEAGFPPQTIWASKTSAMQGETIVLSTVVYNSDAATLKGTLVFIAKDARIGAREFEVPGGESQIQSVEWKPLAGEYEVAAAIEGTSAELSKKETPSIVVKVAPPPPPSAVEKTVSQVVHVASSSLPFVQAVTTNVFNAIEPYRQAGVDRLKAYVAAGNVGKTPGGVIAGTSTTNTSGFKNGTTASKGGLVSSLVRGAAGIALMIMGSLYLFYPFLAIIILGGLYMLARRVRRKSS